MAFDLQTFAWSVVTAGGGGAALTYGAFKVFGTKWLDSHFAARLQELKHSHDREMAALKATIDERHDRAVKLNQREFEVVPDIWKNATEAHYAVLRLISRWQEGPDVGKMAEPQFEAWLAGSRLQDWQKDEIKTKDRFDRTSYYSEASRWLRLFDATEAVVAFNRSLLMSSIFVHPDTYEKFQVFGRAFEDAHNGFRIGMQMGDEFREAKNGEDDPIEKYRITGAKSYDKLARYLRERYWINSKGEAL